MEGNEMQRKADKVRVGRCDLFIWGVGEDPDVVGYFSDEDETYVGCIKQDGSLLFTCGKEKTVLTFGGLRAASLGAAAVCPPNREDAMLPAGVCSLLIGWYEPVAAGNRGYFSDAAGTYTAFVGTDDKVLFWGTGLKDRGGPIPQLAELYELALKAHQKDPQGAQGKVGQWVCSWQKGAQQSADGGHMERVAASLRASAARLERDAALRVMLAGKLITEQRAKEVSAEEWSLDLLAGFVEERSIVRYGDRGPSYAWLKWERLEVGESAELAVVHVLAISGGATTITEWSNVRDAFLYVELLEKIPKNNQGSVFVRLPGTTSGKPNIKVPANRLKVGS